MSPNNSLRNINDKKIKVFFIKLIKRSVNTASENRFWAIYQMVKMNFQTDIIYTSNIKYHFRLRFFRFVYNRIRIFSALVELSKKRKRKDINIIYLFKTDPLLSIFFFIYASIFNFILVSERNELPNSIIHNRKYLIFLEKILIYPWYYKLYKGYTLISDELIKHYSPYLTKSQIVFKLPMTVDFSRFTNVGKENSTNYIFYAGSLDNTKDGIKYLISAFSEVEVFLDNVLLIIAGNSSKTELKALEMYISEKKTKGIILLDNISRNDIPKYMINAKVCVLPRPNSIQSNGGFPTKLGEYLATGLPVIVTNIGEISSYLSEKEVYFISHNEIESQLKLKLVEIFSDYGKALIKGQLGRLKALKHFSLESNKEIIREFILSSVRNYF